MSIGILAALLASPLAAQSNDGWAVGLSGGYATPINGLNDWFQPAPEFGISAGRSLANGWFVEGLAEYVRFDDENLSGYADGRVDLFLEHGALLVSGKYPFASGMLRPYAHLAGGLYYWKGRRGAIAVDSTVSPSVPFIPARTLEEFNMGFRAGVGLETRVSERLAVDVLAHFRLVVGELWPTLQPNIELEGVSTLQSVNVDLVLRYFF